MKVGYARISTAEQNLEMQIEFLKKAGCKKIFTDTISGALSKRKGLEELNEYVRSGDVVVVWKLDRLGRSLSHLIETVNSYEERGVGFKSLTENIDTTTPGGRLTFHIFGALAEFERELIKERTRAGLEAARAQGRVGGRPRALTDKQAQMVKTMRDSGEYTIKEICKQFDISRATLYRSINASNVN